MRLLLGGADDWHLGRQAAKCRLTKRQFPAKLPEIQAWAPGKEFDMHSRRGAIFQNQINRLNEIRK